MMLKGFSAVLLSFVLAGAVWAPAVEPMERAVDTEASWAAQADQVPAATDAAPVFTGMLVWSGRADRNYMPFFQWEIRLKGGAEALRNLRLRVQPLGPDLKDLAAARTGHWQSLGDLPAGEEVDLSYMINTPIFPAYRVLLQWQGGEASYLASDRQMLPRREGGANNEPQLVVLDPRWERNARGQAKVGFWLRNQGGAAAEGVKITLNLRDGAGKVVLSHPYIPEDGSIPAGYAKPQEVTITRSPPFHNVQIAISSAETSTTALDPAALGDDATVSVGELRKEGEVLHGKLRNGSSDNLVDVAITVTFVDASGARIGEGVAKVPAAAAGAVVEWQLSLTDIPAWSGYETSLSFGVDDLTPAAAGGENDSAAPAAVITVEGLSLTILDTQGAEGVLKIQGELHNHSGGDLAGLQVTLTISDATAPVVLNVGDLPHGERLVLSALAEGVERLSGLSLSWRSGVSVP